MTVGRTYSVYQAATVEEFITSTSMNHRLQTATAGFGGTQTVGS